MGGQLNTKNSTLKTDSALIIFAKAPIPGQVKTRLCPPLTPDEAASLHGSLVLDTLERTRAPSLTLPLGRGPAIARPRGSRRARLSRAREGWGWDRFLACAPSPEHVFFKILAEREGVRLLPQTGEDLGSRMSHAFDVVFGMGYRRAVLTGSDLPSLSATVYGEALSRLQDHDLVLGPSLDGGYYLIGLTQPVPELFAGIPWSTNQVFDLTIKKAQNLRLSTAVLSMGRDLDTIEDLLALIPLTLPSLARASPVESLWVERSQAPRKLGEGKGERQQGALSARTTGVLRLLATRLQARSAIPSTAGRAHLLKSD